MKFSLVSAVLYLSTVAQARQDSLKPVTLHFAKTSSNLNNRHKLQLDSVLNQARLFPNFQARVQGYCEGGCGEQASVDGAREWDRVNSVVNFLIRQGLNEDRLVYSFDGATPGSASIQLVKYEGFRYPPAPHPNLHKKTKK